jgi:hypothetical protein
MLESPLTFLRFGDVGVDADRTAVRRRELAGGHPASVTQALLTRAEGPAMVGRAAREPFRQRRTILERQDVLVEQRGHLVEGLAEHQPVTNTFEHVAELAVVQHQTIVRVP